KWDYELHHGVDLESVVDRALAIAQTEPAGPVYLTLPREVLAEPVEGLTYQEQPLMAKAAEAVPSPEAITQAARALARAKNPILVTRTVGRDPRAVQPLVELAELLGMGVYEAGGSFVNFPKNHPLYGGADVAGVLPQADVVLVAEADVPWVPKRTSPRGDATVIAMGVDPLFTRYPVRSFRADLTLAGSPRLTFQALVSALKTIGVDAAAAQARTAERAKASRQRDQELRQRAEAGKGQRPINKAYFSRCLADAIDEDTVILNELGVDVSQIEFKRPGAFYGGSVAGSLGWSVGASLGVKLAAPAKTVVCCVGDGSYIFGSGEAGHMVSDVQGLPVLTVVWNNGIWNAVQNATRTTYADGHAVRSNSFAITALSQSFRYELICQAAGGYGERVEDPAEVPAAIKRALTAVREGKRQALLNVIGQ
ncbi:MAG: decarboxylase, partial [Chloroflexi bacterium]|nr:decarboxylase [Chloroflexota bacterium]